MNVLATCLGIECPNTATHNTRETVLSRDRRSNVEVSQVGEVIQTSLL